MTENNSSTSMKKRRDWGMLGLGAAVVLLIWFALANTAEVTVSFWGYHGHTHVISVIVICALLGGCAGFALGRQRRRGQGPR